MTFPELYSDDYVEIKLKKELDIVDTPRVAIACIEAGLIGLKSYCRLAKDPMELRKDCKRDIMEAIDIVEDILKNNE